LLTILPVKLIVQPRFEKADLIVLLDTNTIQQLDKWSETIKASSSPLIVIDHHFPHPEAERPATVYVVDEEASSTCEIIYQFFKEIEVELTETEAKALFLGIAFDTKHFILADSVTFKIIADLVDVGVNVEEALTLFSLPRGFSERVARLKACKRVKLKRINEWLIAPSYVSAYQASVARALIGIGAYVAVVTGQKGDALQISIRSCRDFYEKTGIQLGRDVAKPLGECIHGMGEVIQHQRELMGLAMCRRV